MIALHPTYVIANRAQIENEIERLIGLLDTADGDCDLELEQDAAIDDGPCDQGPYNLLPHRPIYGLDQSHGPINEREAYRAWQRDDPGKFAHRH